MLTLWYRQRTDFGSFLNSTEGKKGVAEHRKEATVYFAVDSEDRYYIGSTEWPEERRREHERFGKRIIEEFPSTRETRYDDEYRSNLKGNR